MYLKFGQKYELPKTKRYLYQRYCEDKCIPLKTVDILSRVCDPADLVDIIKSEQYQILDFTGDDGDFSSDFDKGKILADKGYVVLELKPRTSPTPLAFGVATPSELVTPVDYERLWRDYEILGWSAVQIDDNEKYLVYYNKIKGD